MRAFEPFNRKYKWNRPEDMKTIIEYLESTGKIILFSSPKIVHAALNTLAKVTASGLLCVAPQLVTATLAVSTAARTVYPLANSSNKISINTVAQGEAIRSENAITVLAPLAKLTFPNDAWSSLPTAE